MSGGVGPIVSWSGPCPAIDPGRILRLHGYKDPDRVRPVIRSAAAGIAVRAQELAAVQGSWRRVDIEVVAGGTVRLPDDNTLRCPAFDRLLAGAREAIVFVLTLGEAFDHSVADLVDNAPGPLDALFLETAGRLAIEKLTRVMAAEIGDRLAAEALTLGPRLGPGYSYRVEGTTTGERVMWPLEQQHELFALFGGARLPVTLLESSAMRPKMSRSGLIGVCAAPVSSRTPLESP